MRITDGFWHVAAGAAAVVVDPLGCCCRCCCGDDWPRQPASCSADRGRVADPAAAADGWGAGCGAGCGGGGGGMVTPAVLSAAAEAEFQAEAEFRAIDRSVACSSSHFFICCSASFFSCLIMARSTCGSSVSSSEMTHAVDPGLTVVAAGGDGWFSVNCWSCSRCNTLDAKSATLSTPRWRSCCSR